MEQKKNVFTRSAELGLPFGCLLIVASLSMIFGDKVPLLSALTIIIAIAAPFIIYKMQRNMYVKSNGFSTFSELWTLGIFTTIGGALICALVTYGVITYFRPDFLYDQAQMIVDTYKQLPGSQGKDIADIFSKMIKNNLLPSPIEYCMQMFWLTASLGCIGGAITGFIACKRPFKKDNNTTTTI
jgi:hypothetical protein